MTPETPRQELIRRAELKDGMTPAAVYDAVEKWAERETDEVVYHLIARLGTHVYADGNA